MAGDSKKLQPIIIKRVRKGGHAKHGGAWKIAYADFVTAMMAFFLLMWLLGSTTEGDKKGIADFFNSPLKVSLMGGTGSGDSSSVVHGGGADLSRSTGPGEGRRRARETASAEPEGTAGRAEAHRDGQARGLEGEGRASARREPQACRHEGSDPPRHDARRRLRIQITDEQNRPMFDSGSAIVKPYMRELLARDRQGALRRAEPHHARRSHRCTGLRWRRSRLQQLGVVERPRQRVAPRDRRRRPSRRPHAAGPGDGVEQVAGAERSGEPPEPAHQHHRHEPRGRGAIAEDRTGAGGERSRDGGRSGHLANGVPRPPGRDRPGLVPGVGLGPSRSPAPGAWSRASAGTGASAAACRGAPGTPPFRRTARQASGRSSPRPPAWRPRIVRAVRRAREAHPGWRSRARRRARRAPTRRPIGTMP